MPPLTPEQLAEASARLDGLTQKLEKTVLDDICRRIAKAGAVTDSAEWQMLRLKEMGYANDVIEQAVAEYTKKSAAEVQQLFHEAAQVSDVFYSEMYTQSGKPFVPVEDNPYMQQLISSVIEQTQNELVNLTRSMGFAVRQPDGSTTFKPAAKAYQSALDLAQMQVATGTFDYTTAIRNSVKSLTDGGLQFVDYASGHRNRADVAARRAILTGLSQMTGQVSKHNAEELETDIVEVTAHAGARPSHAEWQGRRYSLSGKSKEYPSLEEATGYGTGDGLKGWNCRHDFYPVFEFSPPAYTEEQLANIDPPPIEYNGKTLTYYECTQKQRAMETAMRKTKREIIAAKASGDDDMFTAKSIRLRRQKEEYAKFSKSAGMLTQNERAQVYGFDKSISAKAAWAVRKAAKPLDNGGGSGIIKESGKNPITQITDKAIERVPVVKISGYTDEQSIFIQQQHKNLLAYSRDNNEHKEIALVFTNNFGDRKEFIGTDDKLDFGNSLYGTDLFVMHNHPRNSSYSFNDIIEFVANDSIKTLSIVKNNGTVEVLTKLSSYDKLNVLTELSRLEKNNVKVGSDEEYRKIINKFLNKYNEGGIFEWTK